MEKLTEKSPLLPLCKIVHEIFTSYNSSFNSFKLIGSFFLFENLPLLPLHPEQGLKVMVVDGKPVRVAVTRYHLKRLGILVAIERSIKMAVALCERINSKYGDVYIYT